MTYRAIFLYKRFQMIQIQSSLQPLSRYTVSPIHQNYLYTSPFVQQENKIYTHCMYSSDAKQYIY